MNQTKPTSKPPKQPRRPLLSPMQLLFVQHFAGDATAAAKAAGYKTPNCASPKLMKLPKVVKAINAKQSAFLQQIGKNEARGVTVTRNDIINRLDALSTAAEADSAKVSALSVLAKIFRMIVAQTEDVTRKFADWTTEEMLEYARSGVLPERFRSSAGPGTVSGSSGDAPNIQ